uniref:LOB domain-containing protein 36-like n=1 Tax=Tanacetum cinerariifolium TaxID=118510 RepID=A0A6L2M2N1_TANCI|nr:LOB domain-containing protein 36-like [Tanacetum cinerariifolium]
MRGQDRQDRDQKKEDQPAKFNNVHKVFGASRVAKILDTLITSQREDAINSLAFEVDARLKDLVYGSAGLIRALQHSLNQAQVGGPGTSSNMLLGPQQQHLYEAQLVDVSDAGFGPLASVNEANPMEKRQQTCMLEYTFDVNTYLQHTTNSMTTTY